VTNKNVKGPNKHNYKEKKRTLKIESLFNALRSHILAAISGHIPMDGPKLLKLMPKNYNKEKWWKFYKDDGHKTKYCWNLDRVLNNLVKKQKPNQSSRSSIKGKGSI